MLLDTLYFVWYKVPNCFSCLTNSLHSFLSILLHTGNRNLVSNIFICCISVKMGSFSCFCQNYFGLCQYLVLSSSPVLRNKATLIYGRLIIQTDSLVVEQIDPIKFAGFRVQVNFWSKLFEPIEVEVRIEGLVSSHFQFLQFLFRPHTTMYVGNGDHVGNVLLIGMRTTSAQEYGMSYFCMVISLFTTLEAVIVALCQYLSESTFDFCFSH